MSTEKKEYAFPLLDEEMTRIQNGMTLRDYFANSAMQSIMVSADYRNHQTAEQISKGAYALADAMLKQREL